MDQKRRVVEMVSMLMSRAEADRVPALQDARTERLLAGDRKPKFYKVAAWMPKTVPDERPNVFRDLVRRKLENRFHDRDVDVVSMDVHLGFVGFFRADAKVMVV